LTWKGRKEEALRHRKRREKSTQHPNVEKSAGPFLGLEELCSKRERDFRERKASLWRHNYEKISEKEGGEKDFQLPFKWKRGRFTAALTRKKRRPY